MVKVFTSKQKARVEAAKVPGSHIHYWQGKYYVTRPDEKWEKPKAYPRSGSIDVTNLSPSRQRETAEEKGYILMEYNGRIFAVPPIKKDITESMALQKAYSQAGWDIRVEDGRTYAVWTKAGEPQYPAVVDVTESMAGAKQLKEEGYEITSVEGRTFAVHPRAGVTTEDLAEAVREARREAGKELAEWVAQQYDQIKSTLDDLQRRGIIKYTEGKKIGEFGIDLLKSVDKLTEKDIELLSKIGFNKEDLTRTSPLYQITYETYEPIYAPGTKQPIGTKKVMKTKTFHTEDEMKEFIASLPGYMITVTVPTLTGDFETRIFASREEADRFIKNWRQEQIKKAGFKGTWEEFKDWLKERDKAIDWLKDHKTVDIKSIDGEDVVVLAKPLDALSDTEIENLRKIGLNVPTLPKGPSRIFYEATTGSIDEKLKFLEMIPSDWVKGLVDKFKAERKQAGASTALLGDFIEGATSIVVEPYKLIATLIPGDQPFEKGWRNVTTRNLKYIDDYTPEQLRALRIAGLATTGLGAYLSAIPIGMSAKMISNLVKTHAPLAGITAPSKIQSLTNFLVKHPKAVQATLLAPAAGLEVGNVLLQLSKGVDPEDILFEEARRFAKLTGQISGFKTGWKLTKDKWAQINQYLDINVKQTKHGPVVTLTKKTKKIPKWLADALREEVDPTTGEIILVGKGTRGAFSQYMALKGGKWFQKLVQLHRQKWAGEAPQVRRELCTDDARGNSVMGSICQVWSQYSTR